MEEEEEEDWKKLNPTKEYPKEQMKIATKLKKEEYENYIKSWIQTIEELKNRKESIKETPEDLQINMYLDSMRELLQIHSKEQVKKMDMSYINNIKAKNCKELVEKALEIALNEK